MIPDEDMEGELVKPNKEVEGGGNEELTTTPEEQMRGSPRTSEQVMEEEQMEVVQMSGDTVNQGMWEILKEMKTVLIGAKGTVVGEIGTEIEKNTFTMPEGEEDVLINEEVQVLGRVGIGIQAQERDNGILGNDGTNSPPQEENEEKIREEDGMEMEEEASLLKEGEELLLKEKVLMQLLEVGRERNYVLEGKVAEMEETEVTLRAFTRLCQKDVMIMEGRMERSQKRELELKAQVLELMRELGEIRKEKVPLEDTVRVSLANEVLAKVDLVEESMANEPVKEVVVPPVAEVNFRSLDIREKVVKVDDSNSGSSSSTSSNGMSDGSGKGRAWGKGSEKGKGKAPVDGSGKTIMGRKVKSSAEEDWGNSENKRSRTELDQGVGGFGRTEVRGGVRITAELAAYYHKNWKIWYRDSVKVDFKGIGPNRGWKFLADVSKEELRRVNFSIKDNTGMAVRGDMDVRVIINRLEGLETEIRRLQFYYMERRRNWLESGERKGWKDELAEKETEMVVRGPFKPVLKAIQVIKEEWKYWKGILGNERATRVRECFGKVTRDHLFWICNPEQCWSRFI